MKGLIKIYKQPANEGPLGATSGRVGRVSFLINFNVFWNVYIVLQGYKNMSLQAYYKLQQIFFKINENALWLKIRSDVTKWSKNAS